MPTIKTTSRDEFLLLLDANKCSVIKWNMHYERRKDYMTSIIRFYAILRQGKKICTYELARDESVDDVERHLEARGYVVNEGIWEEKDLELI